MFEHDFKKYPELQTSELNTLGFMSPFPQITQDFDAFVEEVHDGDTVTLSCSFRDFKFPLRFSDVDAPELSTGEPGAKARDWLTNEIKGKQVRILIDPKNRVEKWGRLLGRCTISGLNLGDSEIRLGLAYPYGKALDGQLPKIEKELRLEKWLKT